jgi:hypothetical protein
LHMAPSLWWFKQTRDIRFAGPDAKYTEIVCKIVK